MRHGWHVFISLLLWCLFGYYWYVVARRQVSADSGVAVLVLLGFLAVALFLTLAWVLHNKRLAARLGRRKGFKSPTETFTHDYLGRPLVAPPLVVLRSSTSVVLTLDDEGRKVYRIVSEEEL